MACSALVSSVRPRLEPLFESVLKTLQGINPELPSPICSEDWSRRRLVPLHRFHPYLWRAVGSEPHSSSLREDVPRCIDIPIDGDVALRAVEGAPPIRVRSRPTYRAVHTRSSCCHVDDRYSFPPRLVLDLPLELVEAP